MATAALAAAAIALAGCGSGGSVGSGAAAGAGAPGATVAAGTGTALRPHPQVVEPSAGARATANTASDPVGDPNAHAPTLRQVRQLLRLQLVAVKKSNAGYIDPLSYVTAWERTDQGVDAVLPVGAPIVAPCTIKILDIEPDWYAGQPLVYFELLVGPDAGSVQYVAEQITDIAPPGSILQQGQTIAVFAKSGTAIEYGWSTANGITIARATTGYEEGQVTPAGRNMRRWLNALGANAGNS